MRVIAGTAKGAALAAPKGHATRPTADRVKEAIFAVIQPDIAGSRVLDLFAGSGALGIEALSRGAACALFVDSRRDSAAAIRQNLEKTRLAGKARVLQKDVFAALEGIKGEAFDIVFMDPPYGAGYAAPALQSLARNGLLRPQGIAVAECGAGAPAEIPEGFAAYRQKRYGRTAVLFLRKE